jgi:hypothetical protein
MLVSGMAAFTSKLQSVVFNNVTLLHFDRLVRTCASPKLTVWPRGHPVIINLHHRRWHIRVRLSSSPVQSERRPNYSSLSPHHESRLPLGTPSRIFGKPQQPPPNTGSLTRVRREFEVQCRDCSVYLPSRVEHVPAFAPATRHGRLLRLPASAGFPIHAPRESEVQRLGCSVFWPSPAEHVPA